MDGKIADQYRERAWDLMSARVRASAALAAMQYCGSRLHSSRKPRGGGTGVPIDIRVAESPSAATVGLAQVAAPTPAHIRARNRLVIFAIALLSARRQDILGTVSR